MFQQGIQLCARITLCPKKLLKIKSIHGYIGFIAHTIRGYILVIKSHERPGTNHVKASVLLEKLQRSGAIGIFLHLIEEDKRVPLDEPGAGRAERDIVQDAVHLKSILKHQFVLRMGHKVDFHKGGVCFTKFSHRIGFPHLTRSADDKRLVIRLFLPLF